VTGDERVWHTPQLVTLASSRPGEVVLSGCKTLGAGQGLGSADNDCLWDTCLSPCDLVGAS
jgi:hypothetical protein